MQEEAKSSAKVERDNDYLVAEAKDADFGKNRERAANAYRVRYATASQDERMRQFVKERGVPLEAPRRPSTLGRASTAGRSSGIWNEQPSGGDE